jgi:MEMO1 family protein
MERPKIRWVEAMPFSRDGQEMILIRDTEGIVEESLLVPKGMACLIALMDGTRTLRDIQADYMRESGELIYMEQIEELVRTMDEALFLDNERFSTAWRKARLEYENAPVRNARLAGKSYPGNRMDLLTFLDEMFRADGHRPGTATKATCSGLPGGNGILDSGAEITGILAPHIDYSRGYEVYRKTYPYLKGTDKPLLVVLGTCHQPSEGIWSISLKDQETPIDFIPCSREMASLISRHRVLKRHIAEWPHRNEHSIELQLPLIQFNTLHDFELLPILTGSMQEYIEGTRDIGDSELTDIVEGFKEMLAACGRPYLILSGADLAHIGAQFGDRSPLNRFVLEESKEKDQAILKSVAAVDAGGFFEAVRRERDMRRICGLTPIYFQLRLLEGDNCEIVDYGQWTDGASSVSFAGGVFYR